MNTNIDEEKDKTNIKIDAAKQKYMIEGKEYSPWQKPAIEARTPTEIAQDEELFFLYRYEDYELYKKFQTFGNKEKLHMQAASKMSIKALSKYIHANVPDLKFGLCHGTRRGNEQKWFKEYISLSLCIFQLFRSRIRSRNMLEKLDIVFKGEWSLYN